MRTGKLKTEATNEYVSIFYELQNPLKGLAAIYMKPGPAKARAYGR